jgi:hypothetical protein
LLLLLLLLLLPPLPPQTPNPFSADVYRYIIICRNGRAKISSIKNWSREAFMQF